MLCAPTEWVQICFGGGKPPPYGNPFTYGQGAGTAVSL